MGVDWELQSGSGLTLYNPLLFLISISDVTCVGLMVRLEQTDNETIESLMYRPTHVLSVFLWF